MVWLNLAVFERERLRIAPDEAVARLRRLARERTPHGSPCHLGGDSCTESGGDEDGKASRKHPSTGALSDLRSGRDGSGALLITEAEAGALEALNGKQKGFCEREGSRLTLAMYCGLILLPGSGGGRRRGARTESAAIHHAEGATLEILPKIWGAIEREGSDASSLLDASEKQARHALTRARRALLRLLQARDELPVSPIEAAPQATDEAPLLDLFIRSFLREVLRVAKGGLLTRYVEVTDEQPVIRGRLHIAESERLARARPGLWSCTRDDLSADNAYNQALLAAIERVRPHARRRATERLWLEARAFFDGVSLLRLTPEAVDRLKLGRESVRYGEALRWARLLLALLAPTLAGGAAPAPALLFNMQTLFEHWVARHERAAAPEGIVVALKGTSRELAAIGRGGAAAGPPTSSAAPKAFRQMPDISLWARGADRDLDSPDAIVDAKWKWIDPSRTDWGVSDQDARQAFTYLLRYGCDRARLAYPILSGARLPDDGAPTFWIDAPGGVVSIEVALIPIDV